MKFEIQEFEEHAHNFFDQVASLKWPTTVPMVLRKTPPYWSMMGSDLKKRDPLPGLHHIICDKWAETALFSGRAEAQFSMTKDFPPHLRVRYSVIDTKNAVLWRADIAIALKLPEM